MNEERFDVVAALIVAVPATLTALLVIAGVGWFLSGLAVGYNG
jgi:hypothetical protein